MVNLIHKLRYNKFIISCIDSIIGKSGKRRHTLNPNTDQYLSSNATDEDSGFSSSDPVNKMVRFDEELLLLKVLMKEVNEPIVTNNSQLKNKINAMKAMNTNYSSKSKNGKYELKILSQPEEQHSLMYQKKKRDMSSIHKNYFNRAIIESDENALLDISDFDTIDGHNHRSQQFYQLIGKSGKRRHTLNPNTDQYLSSNATDEDSGFSSSDPVNKMVRFDEELLLLKVLMKEVNEPIVTNNSQLKNKINAMKAMNTNYSSKSKNGKYELKILSQPEEQHRARYLTEGSRGAIKDKSGLGHPLVKLCGYNKGPVKVQCFIGHDKQLGQSHLFYQASKITGKNSTRCSTKRMDGTTIITMDACPENDMQVTVDCVGILKERNVDVEQKLTQYKTRSEKDELVAVPTKKRSTRCRLVFRAQIPETNEILQVVSSPILCTQPLGTPEISKKSLSECGINGGVELFIIGKNFLKDAKVVWKSTDWTKVVEPDKEFLHPTHLVCIVPRYDGPNQTKGSIDVSLLIKSGGKYSDPHKFTFINVERVSTMSLLNGTAQINGGSATEQFLVSNLQKPIILTMIGSTAPATVMADHSMDSQMATQNSFQSNISQMSTNCLNSETLHYTTANSSPQSIISIIDEDTNMSSSFHMTTNSSPVQTDSQMNQTFNFTNGLIFNKTPQNIDNNDNNIDAKVFKTENPIVVNSNSCDTSPTTVEPLQPMAEAVPQYLPLNSFNEISTNAMVVNDSNQMTDISTIPAISSISCEPYSQPMHSTVMSAISTGQSLSMTPSMASIPTPIENKSTAQSCQTDAFKSITAQNPVLSMTASTTTPVTQANNISALSEMSDAELLCFINPATFDTI